MPKAPEVQHLERAVEAVKRGLLPEKQREPSKEDLHEQEPDNDEGERDQQ